MMKLLQAALQHHRKTISFQVRESSLYHNFQKPQKGEGLQAAWSSFEKANSDLF